MTRYVDLYIGPSLQERRLQELGRQMEAMANVTDNDDSFAGVGELEMSMEDSEI